MFERFANLARAGLERPATGMERRDDDEAFARQMQQEFAMDEGRAGRSAAAVRKQDDWVKSARSNRRIATSRQDHRPIFDRTFRYLRGVGDEGVKRLAVLHADTHHAGV